MRLHCLQIFLLLGFHGVIFASDEQVDVLRLEDDATSPAAQIEDIAWLSGRWIGKGLGGTAEDVISPAADGQMMGMFRHLKKDQSINFYEFYVFAEKDGSLTQRLKHFSPLLASWEEKEEFVEFPLVKITDNAAYFDGLTYVLRPDDSLVVGVRISEDQVAYFRYQRSD